MAAPVAALDVLSAINSLVERKERLHKAFSELESKQAVLDNLGADWKDVEDHLSEVQERLRNTFEELISKEQNFEAKVREAKEALDKREADVSKREIASLAFVQEKKDAAVAAILEMKQKRADEQKEEEKDQATSTRDRLRAADMSAQSPDAASYEIVNGLAMDVDAKSAADRTGFYNTVGLSGVVREARASASKADEVKPRPMLKHLCEAMDSENLRCFIAEHRKDLNAISAELPFALKAAADPAQLVLKALEGYHHLDQISGSHFKKDVSLPASKRACIILLEALAVVLTDGAVHPIVSEELKKSARQVADSWRSKINIDVDLTSHQSIEAQSLLQLLATFGLASEYDQDELCKLVFPITRRKQTPSLCRSLGLSPKIPEIIEKLIRDGKHMEAISFAAEFNLLDRFPPVPLLKLHLKDARRLAHNTLRAGHNSSAAQNDANQKELSALRAVLKTINDLELEDKFSPAPLEKRVVELEKAKADKKRAAVYGRSQQMKRARTNTSGAGGGMTHDKSYHPSEGRVSYGDSVLSYNTMTHPGYDRHLVGYGSTYAAASRSPVLLQTSYTYPSNDAVSLGYGSSSSSYTGATAYNGYSYGTGLPSGYQSYH